jgi:molecular chaperone GrpE (heat shock protein)
VAELRRQVERLRLAETDRIDQAVRSQMERFLAASATRITQLNTQAHLMDVDGKPVAARDVMANARGLLRILEDEGMTFLGPPGERLPFDPSLHEPLQAGVEIRPGEFVEIRLSGVAFQGRLLRKAGVIRTESSPWP